jgi:hypothetical protein
MPPGWVQPDQQWWFEGPDDLPLLDGKAGFWYPSVIRYFDPVTNSFAVIVIGPPGAPNCSAAG